MKEDREFKWVINLLSSKRFSNVLSNKDCGRFCDFESCANNSARDKEFGEWFKFLVKEGIINFLEYRENPKGLPAKIYQLDRKRLIRLFEKFDLFKKIDEIFTLIIR